MKMTITALLSRSLPFSAESPFFDVAALPILANTDRMEIGGDHDDDDEVGDLMPCTCRYSKTDGRHPDAFVDSVPQVRQCQSCLADRYLPPPPIARAHTLTDFRALLPATSGNLHSSFLFRHLPSSLPVIDARQTAGPPRGVTERERERVSEQVALLTISLETEESDSDSSLGRRKGLVGSWRRACVTKHRRSEFCCCCCCC